MKRIMPIALLVLVAALAAPNLCLSDDGQTLNPEVKVRLEELKENEDLTGIVRLWEEAGKTCPSRVEPTFAQALLSFPREKFVPALLQGMQSEEHSVSNWCRGVIIRLKEKAGLEIPIRKIIPPPLSEEERKKAIEITKGLGHEDYRKRKAAREMLLSMGPRVAELLEPLVRDNDLEIAAAASDILKSLRSEVTAADISMLAQVGGDEALGALRAIVRSHGFEDDVVSYAICALGDLGLIDDAEIIRPYIYSNKERFVRAAMYALWNLKDAGAVPALIDYLQKEPDKYRAVRMLGRIGDRRAINHLVKTLNNSRTFWQKLHCACALAQVGEKEHLHDLLENASMGDIEGTFGAEGFHTYPFGPEEAKFLIKHVRRIANSSGTAHSIIYSFSKMAKRGDPEAIAAVRQARKNVSADGLTWHEKSFYGGILTKLGDAEEEQKLLACAGDKDAQTRYKALRTLAYTGNEKYLPLFAEALDDTAGLQHPYLSEIVEVRRAAILGITRISKEPFDLWDFDRDRQVKEIKEWYKKYQEQKAAHGE